MSRADAPPRPDPASAPAAGAAGARGELARRFAVAGVGIPLCVVVVWVGGVVYVLGLAALAGVAVREFVVMYKAGGHRPYLSIGLVGATGFPVLVHYTNLAVAWEVTGFFLMAASLVAMLRTPPEEGPVSSAALTAFGVLYVGGLLSFAVPIREGFEEERAARTLLFFLPVAVTWLADSAAYFGGKSFGRRRLAPRISPNKTVEGAVAALVAGVAGAAAYGAWVLPLAGTRLDPPSGVVLGFLIAAAGVLGDLVESAMKRECGVKDSSSLLPGHGGLLDRLDALLWVFPVTYFFLLLTW